MGGEKNAERVEKIKAFFAARYELTRTAEAILMLKNAQREMPEEFGNDAQLGKFIDALRRMKDFLDELAKSESWSSRQVAFHNKMLHGCDEWIDFFHNHSLLGEFMTMNEVVTTLGARAIELGKTTMQLANELDILL